MVTIALLEMSFSFPQVHILHGCGLHIREACNNVIIICLLYMNKTNTGRKDTFTPGHYSETCMEIFSCGQCFNGWRKSWCLASFAGVGLQAGKVVWNAREQETTSGDLTHVWGDY